MIALLAVSLAFVVPGALAYSGHWRSWTSQFMATRYLGFSVFFLGAAGACSAPALALHGVLAAVFDVPLIVFFVLMMVSLIWLPSFLLPAWFKQWRANGSDKAAYARVMSRTRRRG